ncbi:MAG TPA: NAD(P)-binding domain-containing protein [Gemmatimonadaceae bacterium]|jgi:predicted dinucleotide-binding enzyme|nr:NAD(P)-binding domain-containing protein [Gemmatimonadaceae bacterium]
MTTAIIGVGLLGTTAARNLVQGGERVILANRDKSKADKLAVELGDLATSAEVGDAISKSDVVVLALYLDVLKFFIPEFGGKLVGKIVVDPSNPVGSDGKGGIKRTLPADQSTGQIVASLLPRGTRFVKAFGTLSADTLAHATRRTPERAVLFYATDDSGAGETVARLITAAGFDPVKVGGVDQSIRIEFGGDLSEFGLNGRLLTIAEAEALIGAEASL